MLLEAVAVEVAVVTVVPVAVVDVPPCGLNGLRAGPLSLDCPGVVWTFSAGIGLAGGAVPCEAWGPGVWLEVVFDSASGTATIAASRTAATGNSFLLCRSFAILRRNAITSGVSSFIAPWESRPRLAPGCLSAELRRSGWSRLRARRASPRPSAPERLAAGMWWR